MNAPYDLNTKRLSYREVVAKYPDVSPFVILKTDVQRRGVTYTPSALAQVNPEIHLTQELLAKLFSIKTAQKSSVLTQFEHGICTFSATAKRSKNHKCPQWR